MNVKCIWGLLGDKHCKCFICINSVILTRGMTYDRSSTINPTYRWANWATGTGFDSSWIPRALLIQHKGERLLRTAFKISLNIAFSEKENSKQCEIFRPRVVEPKIWHTGTGGVPAGTSCPKTWGVSSHHQNNTTRVTTGQSGWGKYCQHLWIGPRTTLADHFLFHDGGFGQTPNCPLSKSYEIHFIELAHFSLYIQFLWYVCVCLCVGGYFPPASSIPT